MAEQREQFEKWWIGHHGGFYFTTRLARYAWEAWQAALAHAPRQSEPTRQAFIDKAVQLLNDWSIPCGASIEEHGDKLIYGSRFMDAMRELWVWLAQGAPRQSEQCPTCGKPVDDKMSECSQWGHSVPKEPTAPTAQDFCSDMIANLRHNVKSAPRQSEQSALLKELIEEYHLNGREHIDPSCHICRIYGDLGAPKEPTTPTNKLQLLASAMKKVLPHALLQELIDTCDPFSAFMREMGEPTAPTEEKYDND